MVRSAIIAVAAAISLVAATAFLASTGSARSDANDCASYQPQIPGPAQFESGIDNPYFPLPVGRKLFYRGIEEGRHEVDRVRVTDRTKVIAGITAMVVNDDVLERGGKLLEKTFDYYAQDDRGNVWYLGENTTEYLPSGKTTTAGSWETGVSGAKPGIIMEADPQVPDAYRQECLSGQAEDLAWVVGSGGSITVPTGVVHRALRTLEFSPLEPAVVDRKVYGPGVGIVAEKQMSGGQETFQLVRVSG